MFNWEIAFLLAAVFVLVVAALAFVKVMRHKPPPKKEDHK